MDLERRFSGLDRLYQTDAMAQLAQCHVVVIGVGGVGSWCVEALARSGIGHLTLIDLDVVAESNINRQLPAMSSTLGESKIGVMADRILEINRNCNVTLIDDFLSEENMDALLGHLTAERTWIVDAIDSVKVKAALIAWAKRRKLKIIVSGAAGGKIDAQSFMIDDLSKTYHDPLCASLKANLKKQHGLGKNGAKFGVPVVFSTENMQGSHKGSGGLNCAGYGSIVTMTATMGMMMAGYVINKLLKA
ncbi:tRNA threonylcarbamoyladenosine dehydratase [Wohlfahrtiimonas chitiniclastica]|uniref:tRNA threonylcarbamoyladenosine dehydratase n=1 Tax=Wohlfahrtiimonas chitiniclastica TaxID=400946 RepID=UPI000373F7EF|nr:tRNA threonylcarbamoyladenosine dehydratase [Wohlfahrtiimonas chitiniclastica]MBS7814197.1 tRNA threonylcarbamoyladenosine dehydratase [Wohlfahrtiimonas chitiniclastica]MBS7818196.1 tRNA threonylcarbamoyladenosine dehydratase [Wohlfahrtiimonas chitiniclastica]MBS7826054.1 tRNA threonylcarbamoyladenosine dehydratase [Wohlfahrtiimonas chitiniclastica]